MGELDPALQRAVANLDVEKVRELLATGVDVHGRASGGQGFPEYWSVLHLMAEERRYFRERAPQRIDEIVTLLLRHGADLEARSPRSGWTPLMLAAKRQDLYLARVLVDHGAEVNARTTEEEEFQCSAWHSVKTVPAGTTILGLVLWTASMRGYDGIAELLIENGAAASDEAWRNASQVEGYFDDRFWESLLFTRIAGAGEYGARLKSKR